MERILKCRHCGHLLGEHTAIACRPFDASCDCEFSQEEIVDQIIASATTGYWERTLLVGAAN
mgnify:CR=1 FL=1